MAVFAAQHMLLLYLMRHILKGCSDQSTNTSPEQLQHYFNVAKGAIGFPSLTNLTLFGAS